MGSQKDPMSEGICFVRATSANSTNDGSLSNELSKLAKVAGDDVRNFRRCPRLIDVASKCGDDVQMLRQHDSNHLNNLTDKYTKAVLAIETVKGPCNIGCRSTRREMEMMKLETYSMRRGTKGVCSEKVVGKNIVDVL